MFNHLEMKCENEGKNKMYGEKDGAVSDCCYRGGGFILVKILKSILGMAA